MKKTLALLLAFVMVFAMAVTAYAEPAPDTKVAVFWYAFSDAYLSTVRAELDADFEAAGIDYQDFDSNNNQGTQLEQVRPLLPTVLLFSL